MTEDVRGKHAVLVLAADTPAGGRGLFQQLGALRNAGAASILVTSAVDDADWDAAARRAFAPSVSKGWGEAGGGRRGPSIVPGVGHGGIAH